LLGKNERDPKTQMGRLLAPATVNISFILFLVVNILTTLPMTINNEFVSNKFQPYLETIAYDII